MTGDFFAGIAVGAFAVVLGLFALKLFSRTIGFLLKILIVAITIIMGLGISWYIMFLLFG